MAGRRGPKPKTDITPGEARFILQQMLIDGRISRGDLDEYRKRAEAHAKSLLEQLHSLGWQGAAAGALVASGAAVASVPAAREVVKRAARKVTPEVLATRQLQGQYLGLIRLIPVSRRADFSKMAKEEGREAAIKAMRVELGKTDGGGAKKRRKRSRKAR